MPDIDPDAFLADLHALRQIGRYRIGAVLFQLLDILALALKRMECTLPAGAQSATRLHG
jgi:hypothetical protein